MCLCSLCAYPANLTPSPLPTATFAEVEAKGKGEFYVIGKMRKEFSEVTGAGGAPTTAKERAAAAAPPEAAAPTQGPPVDGVTR